MKELPKKWFVEFTDENINVLNDWRKKQQNVDLDYNHINPGYCLISDGYEDNSYYFASSKSDFLSLKKGYKEISYEDFKKYVLKEGGEETMETQEGTMRKAINKFNGLTLNMDNFYVINLWNVNDIQLQGRFTKEVFDELEAEGFSFDFNKSSKWFQAELDGVKITLIM